MIEAANTATKRPEESRRCEEEVDEEFIERICLTQVCMTNGISNFRSSPLTSRYRLFDRIIGINFSTDYTVLSFCRTVRSKTIVKYKKFR